MREKRRTMNLQTLEALAREIGFEDCGACAAGELHVRSDVRDMCALGRCGMFGRNWSCPPACGELEEYAASIAVKSTCLVVQTVRAMEDEFDIETMQEAEAVQKERVFALADKLREEGADVLILASGACTLCPKCTYPDEPCRFPEKRLVSMESAGLMVNEVCQQAQVPYNHGRMTITYTGAVIF